MNELYENNDKSLMDVVCELPEYDEKQFDSQYIIASNAINEWVENEYNKWEKDILTIIPKDKIGLYLLGKLTYILEEFKDYNPYTIEEWNECSSKDSEDCFFCLALKRYVGAINDILYNYDIDEDENIKKIYEYAWFIYGIDEDDEDDEDDDEIPLNTIPEDKLDFSNFSQSKNDELQKYSIQEIKQYALANNIEIIEHARPNSIEIELLCRKLPNTPFAECYDIIEECFERIYNEKKWTLDGKIQIYNQNKKSLYKSFVYDITKNLELLKSSAQEECKKRDGVAAFLTQRNVIKYQDLIDKFNYFYEEWEKNYITPQPESSIFNTTANTNKSTISKYHFDKITIQEIHNLYERHSEFNQICTLHEFGLMFENANFIQSTKPDGGTPSIICYAIYYFQKNIYHGNDRTEWYSNACSSINKSKGAVRSKANRSKYKKYL